MEALGINLGYLLVQILNFVVMFVVLRTWVFIPIMGLLAKRRNAIAQGLEDARMAAEARTNAEEEARQLLAKAQVQASDRIREATERADQAGNEVKAQAEAEAAQIREQAKADAALERERIIRDLRGQVAALTMAATHKLIGEALDETRQHELIDQFFSGVRDGKVIVLDDLNLKGASAEITSALPLSEGEKEVVRREITSKVGAQTVVFRVDPDILGGLVVKVGDKVLDVSIAGQLEFMRERLA